MSASSGERGRRLTQCGELQREVDRRSVGAKSRQVVALDLGAHRSRAGGPAAADPASIAVARAARAASPTSTPTPTRFFPPGVRPRPRIAFILFPFLRRRWSCETSRLVAPPLGTRPPRRRVSGRAPPAGRRAPRLDPRERRRRRNRSRPRERRSSGRNGRVCAHPSTLPLPNVPAARGRPALRRGHERDRSRRGSSARPRR